MTVAARGRGTVDISVTSVKMQRPSRTAATSSLRAGEEGLTSARTVVADSLDSALAGGVDRVGGRVHADHQDGAIDGVGLGGARNRVGWGADRWVVGPPGRSCLQRVGGERRTCLAGPVTASVVKRDVLPLSAFWIRS